MEPVRLGLVGTGYMAREHARAFQGLASIVGVVGRDPARTMRFADEFQIPVRARSPQELLRQCQPDLVVVAVSELDLLDVLPQCLNPVSSLLIEKPLGTDLDASIRIVELLGRGDTQAFVALNRRQYESTRRALKELGHGTAGARIIQVVDQEAPTVALREGRPAEVVRNWMFANSIHLVDLLRVFGRGAISSVRVTNPWSESTPMFVSASIEFDSGDVASYQAIWNRPGPWSCTITTSEARLEMRPLEELTIQRDGERTAQGLELGRVDTLYKPGLRRQAEQAVRATRREAHTLVGIEDALDSVRLVAALYRSPS